MNPKNKNHRESLNLTFLQYQRYRTLLSAALKERLRGRLQTSDEWPAWHEVERMALEASRY